MYIYENRNQNQVQIHVHIARLVNLKKKKKKHENHIPVPLLFFPSALLLPPSVPLTFDFEVLPDLHLLCFCERLLPPHQRLCEGAEVQQLLQSDAQVGEEGGQGGPIRDLLNALKMLFHSDRERGAGRGWGWGLCFLYYK